MYKGRDNQRFNSSCVISFGKDLSKENTGGGEGGGGGQQQSTGQI